MPTADSHLELLTMCDDAFLPQALVLYRSLVAHAPSFRLRVLCLDARTERFFAGAALAGVETMTLAELEAADPELAAVRPQRTWREYCWTATPAFCRLELDRAAPGAVVMWLDAEIELLADPGELLADLGDGSILLTPHNYYRAYPKAAPGWLLTKLYGRFNGGTIAFRADRQGRAAVERWRACSLEWCHDRTEPGRFGNQLYLGDFPERFEGTRILGVPGGGIGPWNSARYRIAVAGPRVLADGRPLVFYHHQSLRLHRAPGWLRGPLLPVNMFSVTHRCGRLVARTTPWYRLSRAERRLLWRPYLRRLAAAVVDTGGHEFEPLTRADVREDFGHRARLAGDRVREHRERLRGRRGRKTATARPEPVEP